MICILVRDFAAIQERLLNPTLPDVPLILVEAGKYRPRVLAPDPVARQMGVKAGMWLGEARTLCPHAEIVPVNEERYQRRFFDITEQLLGITNRIEPEYQATSSAWYVDDRLVLPYLCKAIEEATGITPQIGLAGSKFPARVAAAITAPRITCEIPAGDEKQFLSPYPVSLLPLDKKMHRRLPLLGIHTLGQLAALPRIAVWEQFGKSGRWVHDLASGHDIRPLTPYRAPVTLAQSIMFDDGISDQQILHKTLEQLCLGLINQLAERQANLLTLICVLTNEQVIEHHRYTHQPIKDNLYLLRLLTRMLDSLLIDSPVISIEVRLADIRERKPVQLSLFDARPAIINLHDIAPEWATRHQQADFYHFNLTDEAFLPEELIEKQHVSGA